ncbi:MAG: histidine phosphatase family protein [Eubacteriales bacterium]|nr:histidine phosphatase family protein [Eubacteriales bacterium]
MRNQPENQIELVLIRHGMTEANREGRYLGRTDEPLSREGIRRLREKKAAGLYPELRLLFCSPMRRCLETAQLLYPDAEKRILTEWTEIDFGAFEGKNYRELSGDLRYQEWIDSGGRLPFPEGESREDFLRRSCKGLEQLTAFLDQREREAGGRTERENGEGLPGERLPVGGIVHGGTIMALLSTFCGEEYFACQPANGEGYVCLLERGPEGFRLTKKKRRIGK